MITSSEIGIGNYLENFIIIRSCQVSEVDQPDKNDIKEISDKIVYN